MIRCSAHTRVSSAIATTIIRHVRNRIDQTGGLLGPISLGHKYFGFNRGELLRQAGRLVSRMGAGALQLRLIGDFNNWDRFDCPLVRDQFGVWSIFLPDDKYKDKLVHGSRVKVTVVKESSESVDRIPAYIRRSIQEPDNQFIGQYLESARRRMNSKTRGRPCMVG